MRKLLVHLNFWRWAIGVRLCDFAPLKPRYREVYYEPCPTPGEKCEDGYHHHGRGDHLIPFDPDWSPS